MSLLTRKAPHKVWVQRREKVRDAAGARVNVDVGDRIRVRCAREPVRDWSSAEENQTAGQQVLDLTIIRSRTWPGDINAFIFWGGDMYETIGAPQEYSIGRRTAHWRITAQWIGTDPHPELNVEPAPSDDEPDDGGEVGEP